MIIHPNRTVQRRTLLLIKALLTVVKTSPEALADPDNIRFFSFYKDNETLEDVQLKINGWPNLNSESYRLLHFYALDSELLHRAFLPRPYYDISLILMQHMGIKYRKAQDDPWFSAHRPIDKFGNDTTLRPEDTAFYLADYFLNIVTCDEQYRFCSSITQQ
jgi:hypothetical protein